MAATVQPITTAAVPASVKTDVMPTIGEFFANKNVFITGGTGFLGTVLIEAILAANPDVGTIYLLVRDKYGSNASTRIKRMLTKSIFQAHSAETLAKVVPIIGELDQPQFGMTDDVYQMLCANVNIIYHSAATIKFKSHVRTAIQTNLIGTQRTVQFAKALRQLSAYVYVSTAFCNSNRFGNIQEKVYASAQDPYEMMRLAADDGNWTEEVDVAALTKRLCGDHPNTYTFSKQLAENLILREMAGMAAGIVRPSVVYGTFESPVPGWVGNASSGHLGFLAGYVKGLFRTLSGNPNSVIDVIPCDYVINATLTLGWFVGTRPLDTPEVIHSTSGETNPLTLAKFADLLNQNAHVDPCDSIVWIPNVRIRNGWRYTVFFWMFHYFPAALFYLPELIFPLGKPHHSTFTYMRIFDKGTKAFEYFMNTEFRYSMTNALRVMGHLDASDAERYQFDASGVDWAEFIRRSFLGLRRFYFREAYVTSTWHRAMFKIFETLNFIGWLGILALIYYAMLPICGSSAIALGIALTGWAVLYWL